MTDKYIFMPADTADACISFEPGPICVGDSQVDVFKRWIECDLIEIVHIGRQLGLREDVILIVDESGKLKPHKFNLMGSYFYNVGFMDYIAGDCIIARIGLVPSSDPDFPFPEHDILPLTPELYKFFADFFSGVRRDLV